MQFAGNLIPSLAELGVRAIALAAIAFAAICLLRLKSAAAQHAVWAAVVAGMLLLPALAPLFPALPLRILRASPAPRPAAAAIETAIVADAPAAPAPAIRPATMRPPVTVRHPLTWRQAAAAIYVGGLIVFFGSLASGYRLARKLVSSGAPVARLGSGVLESNRIAVPVTVGFLRPRILLPSAWRGWTADKLEAVLVHERTHVERADWAIAVVAGVNRRLFWFHPLAWWLERRLAVLAERACDDAALLALSSSQSYAPGAREGYAQTLLDMAAAVQSGRGRRVGEAMAMAKTAEVRKRIERILDETRQIPRGLTRARWLALAACSLPLAYLRWTRCGNIYINRGPSRSRRRSRFPSDWMAVAP